MRENGLFPSVRPSVAPYGGLRDWVADLPHSEAGPRLAIFDRDFGAMVIRPQRAFFGAGGFAG